MSTTIALTSKNQCTIPKAFVEAAGLKPKSHLRVTQIGNGLYLSPVPEPTEQEYWDVLKFSHLGKRFGKKEAKMVNEAIKKYRAKNKSRS